jgi:tripartite-type tricarboxylate transporter receptor subunit TctC
MISTVSRWLVLVLFLATALQATARAQTYPDRVVKVIVPVWPKN